MCKRAIGSTWVMTLALAGCWLMGAAGCAATALAQTADPKAAAAPSAAAAPDADPGDDDIVDLACTVTRGGICRPGEDCKQTERVGEETLPLMVTIDFGNRVVMSPLKRGYVSASRIAMLAHDRDELILHGIEHGFAWLISIREDNRGLTMTVASSRGVFAGFGTCVPIAELRAKKD